MTKSALINAPVTSVKRQRRKAATFDEHCDGNVSVLSQAEYISLVVSLVGVPGLAVANAREIGHLACLLAKTINAT